MTAVRSWRDLGHTVHDNALVVIRPDSIARTAEIAAVAGPWPFSKSTVRMFPA